MCILKYYLFKMFQGKQKIVSPTPVEGDKIPVISFFEDSAAGFFKALIDGDMTALASFDSKHSFSISFHERGTNMVATSKHLVKLIADFGDASSSVIDTINQVEPTLSEPVGGKADVAHVAFLSQRINETLGNDKESQSGAVADFYIRLRRNLGGNSGERIKALDTIKKIAMK